MDDAAIALMVKSSNALLNSLPTAKRRKVSKNRDKTNDLLMVECWDFKNIRDVLPSDITIVVQDRKFPMHEFILCAVSPVFLKMFSSHDFLEKKTSSATLREVSVATFKIFADYCYSGATAIMDKDRDVAVLIDLIIFADRYEVASLVKALDRKLILLSQSSQTSCQTILHILDAIDGTGLEELHYALINRLFEKKRPVLKTDHLRELPNNFALPLLHVLYPCADESHKDSGFPHEKRTLVKGV